MEKLKPIPKSKIDYIRWNPNNISLSFAKYGRSENIKDYTDREITEMMYGIYKDAKTLLVDGDYFVDLTKVVATKCILKDVTYYKKPTSSDYDTNYHNRIDNIRTFYIKDYYLITNDEILGSQQHRITRYLYKVGFLNLGHSSFVGLYSISNHYKTMLFGKYPKDLFHPIKRYINGLFFNDDYKIKEFIFESNIEIHSSK